MRKYMVGLVVLGLLAVGAAGQTAGVAARSSARSCRNATAQPPNRGYRDVLAGVVAIRHCRAWAVGSYLKGGHPRTLIEYWDGRSWRVQKSPNPGDYNTLDGVAATSSSNVWAVGSYAMRNPGRGRTLVLHWNGKAWKVQKSPSPRAHGLGDHLSGVAATSPTNAWAVGDKYTAQPLIEHWNGRAWKLQKSPIFPQGVDCCYPQGLEGVGASSATNAWAVGYRDIGFGPGGVIEHWNGRAWKVQRDMGENYSDVSGVAASPRVNAWAVGTYHYDHCGSSSGCVSYSKGVIGRWNGKAWKTQNTPNPGRFNELRGVARTSRTNVWAVGYYCLGSIRGCSTKGQALIEHWNGKAWRIPKRLHPGAPSSNTRLYGVSATSRTNAWAVGSTDSGTLALHWNGKAWRP